MAERWAVTNGNWSNPAIWNGGTLPGAGDDVHPNTFEVTIDQDVTVASLRTLAGSTAAANGMFRVYTSRTVSGDLRADAQIVIAFSAGPGETLTIVGNCYAGTGNAINTGGAGDLVVIGNCYGGSGYLVSAIWQAGSGQVDVIGNCYGGSGYCSAVALNYSSVGVVNVTGNCYAGSGTYCGGVVAWDTGPINVYGEAVAGLGLNQPGVTIQPTTGAFFVQVARSNDYPNGSASSPSYGIYVNQPVASVTVDALVTGSGGWPAVNGRHFVRPAGVNYASFRQSNEGPAVNLGELAADYPEQANVRAGVSFDFGNRVGTCAVPPAASVALGVPVDAATGTAALTPTALLGVDLKARMEQCATVQTVGDQLAALGV